MYIFQRSKDKLSLLTTFSNTNSQIIKFLKRSKHLRYLSPRVASSDDISAARDICVRLFLPNKVAFSYNCIFSYIFQHIEFILFAIAVKGNIYIWTKSTFMSTDTLSSTQRFLLKWMLQENCVSEACFWIILKGVYTLWMFSLKH